MSKERIQQINQLIKKELGQMILEEVEFSKGVLVTLSRAESAPNLIQAKIFISVIPESQTANVLQVLNRRIYNLQQKLNKRLKIRPTPKIEFFEEKRTLEAGKIEELLEELKKAEK